jgi:FeS assembly SUF system regulator
VVLRITKQTDYGIMLLASMALLPPGRILSARDAADWTGLSLPMASKILKGLARGKIVASHRGVGGGYSLARPAEETTLAAVIRALEGPISIVECGADPGQCDQESGCPVRVNWARVSREIERALERMPITDMVTAPSRALLKLGPNPNEQEATGGTS